ncbi:MAG: AraC family transcriptional regulator [Exilibacterium sp.]
MVSNSKEKPTSQNILGLAGVQQLMQAFDLLSDMLFWVKDSESRIVYANRHFLEHIGTHALDQVIGLTDYDFAPRHIAEQFLADDQRIIKGEFVSERLEMNILKSGEICWFSTSKRPLYDSDGQIIGSYGISRHLEKTSIALKALDRLKTPIDYIRTNYMNPISVSELASISNLSVSALERRFATYLSKTPKQFIAEVRLENARRLLVETNLPISSIALHTGFTDPGYFSRLFCRQFNEPPSEFRKRSQRQTD